MGPFNPPPQLISSLRPCSGTEESQLIAHLLTDKNAAGWGQQLIDRLMFASHGVVNGREAVGNLSTLFEVLGSHTGARVAKALIGTKRFPIREARKYWRESSGDETSYRKLEDYIFDTQQGRLANRTITVVDEWRDLRIVDGNKRAIAIYETSPADAGIILPVFVLRWL